MGETIQRSLKELYYSLGGNADNVRDTKDVNAIIGAMTALGLGEQIADGGGGSSDVLVINATPDYDHAESEEEVPLTLDKTATEIAAADKSEVHILIGEGSYYDLALVTKYSPGEAMTLMYATTMGEVVVGATIGINGEAVEAVMNVINLALLPSVTNYDNGKILKVDDGAWGAVNNEFIITCTPTNADMSGTMDKTPAEILEAYLAGKNIKVRVPQNAQGDYNEVFPYTVYVSYNDGEPSSALVAAMAILDDGNGGYILVDFATSASASTYSTKLFTLTPYSP